MSVVLNLKNYNKYLDFSYNLLRPLGDGRPRRDSPEFSPASFPGLGPVPWAQLVRIRTPLLSTLVVVTAPHDSERPPALTDSDEAH